MSLMTLVRGTGRRRRSDESWAELETALSKAQQAARTPIEGAVRCVCQARVHRDWWAYSPVPLPCPFCALGAEQQRTGQARQRIGELEIELELVHDHLKDERTRVKGLEERALAAWALDANLNAVSAPAAADTEGSCFATGRDPAPVAVDADGPRVVADTPAAAPTTDIVSVSETTQPVDLADLRKAAGLDDTAVQPAVALPPDLEPAQAPRIRPWPPARTVPAAETTWTGAPRPTTTPAALPGPTAAVRFAKARAS